MGRMPIVLATFTCSDENFIDLKYKRRSINREAVTYQHLTAMLELNNTSVFISCCAYKRSAVYITFPLPSLDNINNNNNNNKYIYM